MCLNNSPEEGDLVPCQARHVWTNSQSSDSATQDCHGVESGFRIQVGGHVRSHLLTGYKATEDANNTFCTVLDDDASVELKMKFSGFVTPATKNLNAQNI